MGVFRMFDNVRAGGWVGADLIRHQRVEEGLSMLSEFVVLPFELNQMWKISGSALRRLSIFDNLSGDLAEHMCRKVLCMHATLMASWLYSSAGRGARMSWQSMPLACEITVEGRLLVASLGGAI